MVPTAGTATAARSATRAPWSLDRGANPVAGGTRFAVWAPHARQVQVKLQTGAAAGEHALERAEHGVFHATIEGARAGDDYAYVLDHERERPDPVSRFQPEGVHGASRIVDPAAFPSEGVVKLRG
jgi:maltooligosyltrehalose trehalohydrolase